MMNFPTNLNIWKLNSSVKDENGQTIYTDNVFKKVKTCVEPAIDFGWADNKRVIHYVPQILPDNTLQVLNLEFFLLLNRLPKTREYGLS